jgi:hypothetical protein
VPIALGALVYLFRSFFHVTGLMLRGVLRPESRTEFFACLIIGIPFFLIALYLIQKVARLTLLNLLGEEVLRVEPGRLMLRQSVFGMGRWKSFPVDSIADFSLGGTGFLQGSAQRRGSVKLEELMRLERIFGWLEGGLRLFRLWPAFVFRAKGQVCWFGFAMEESQAREILARLRYHLPESAFAQTGELHA